MPLSLSLSPRRVVVLMALVGGCTCIVMRHLVVWRRSLSDTNQAASRRCPGGCFWHWRRRKDVRNDPRS
jgi:hypothetical protein